MSKRIYLIRHGKTETGNEKRYIGITDISLDQEGMKHAEYLKNYFRNIAVEKIYASCLERCLQTAEIICGEKNQEYIIVKEFSEINLGIWENKPVASVKKDFPLEYEARGTDMAFFTPPEGESFHQLAERVLPVFDSLVREHSGNMIIVAHCGVNRVILSRILGISLHDIFRIPQPYGCINELILDDNGQKWQYSLKCYEPF